ncbi:Non-specific serine/threonine protein kinase [Handroanthus impetiginosus]|uniref:Non-specific serine/threonine protein kinase n=1 Tax=Handroanthus impetiginosus TaxID=429701 RepID=A0A2G9HI88_9LAMI|nr:Non-specific serine/threonine protein kinase [Handroanthus impetiginosus]
MRMMMVGVLRLVLKVCAFVCSFAIQESYVVSSVGEGTAKLVSNVNMFINIAPHPILQPKEEIESSNKIVDPYGPVHHSRTQAPSASKSLWSPNVASTPHPFSNSTPGFYSREKHHHVRDYKITPPASKIIPRPASKQAPYRTKSDAKAYLRHNTPPPTSAVPLISPKKLPLGSFPKSRKTPLLPPLQARLPPPPHKECASLTCTEPFTYGLPESPCVCLLPIKVALRVTVALYTFFPLVSELAAEIAAGVCMKQSQVRIMGANEAGDNPEKSIVLIDLVPLHKKFDHTTSYLTFQRFWGKRVVIKTSFFGDYDVLYVRYPVDANLRSSALSTFASVQHWCHRVEAVSW